MYSRLYCWNMIDYRDAMLEAKLLAQIHSFIFTEM